MFPDVTLVDVTVVKVNQLQSWGRKGKRPGTEVLYQGQKLPDCVPAKILQRVTQTGKQDKTHYAQHLEHTACTCQNRQGPRPCAEPWAESSRAADSPACQGSLITFQNNE